MASRVHVLNKHDRDRRTALWCLRFPGPFRTRRRLRWAAAGVLAAVHLGCLVIAASVLAVSLADSVETVQLLTALGLLHALYTMMALTAVPDVRERLADPDTDLLAVLRVSAADVVVARILLRDVLGVALLAVVLILPVSFAATLVLDVDGLVWSGALLVTLAQVAARLLGRLAALRGLTFAVARPPAWRGPLVLTSALLAPLAAAAVITAGSVSMLSFGRSVSIDTVASSAPVAAVGWVMSETGRLVLAAAVLLLIAATAVGLCRAVADRTSLLSMRDAFSTGPRWRTTKPLPIGIAGALREKDLRLLVRRGPVLWESLATAAQLLPTLAAITAGAVALGSSLPLDERPSLARLTVTVLLASTLCGFLAVAGDSIAVLNSVDNDGPALQVLRTRPTVFRTYLGVRAARHASGLYWMAIVAVALLALGASSVLTPVDVVGLALLAAVVACLEGVVLAVATARHSALHRPSVGLPDLEPQVRAMTSAALVGSATVGGFLLLAAQLLPLPTGLGGAVLACVLIAALGHAVARGARRGASVAWSRVEGQMTT